MSLDLELRLVMPEGTTTATPILQARKFKKISGMVIETPWDNVPVVFDNKAYEEAKKKG